MELMELKERFKETECGIIPHDWDIAEIQEVCKLINGRGFKPFEWRKDGLPIIRIQNLNGSEEYNYYQGPYDKKIEIEKGQLLFAWSGSRGTSFGPHVWSKEKGLLNYHTWKVNVLSNRIDEGFFLHQLKSLTKHIEDSAHGAAALVHVQKWEIEKLRFALPRLKTEQTAIATALSDADALIISLEKLIEKKRLIKHGVMQELLRPKEGWVKTQLSDLGNTYGGLSGKASSDFKDGKYPYIPFMNIMRNPIIDIKYFDFVDIKPGERQHQAKQGDLFFNGSSETPDEVGMCSILTEQIPNLYLNSFCFGFRLRDDAPTNGLYLSYFFRSSYGRMIFFSSAQGATRYNLSKQNFLKLKIEIPPLELQEKIASHISDMDNEINALKTKLSKIKSVKQGMMQELLTGKIRLI